MAKQPVANGKHHMCRSAPLCGSSQHSKPPPPYLVGDSGDGDDRVDNDRNVERGRSLSRSGSGVPPGVAPQLHDEIAEAVDDLGVFAKPRLAVDVADGADPFRHTIEVSELSLERREHRETRQTRSFVGLVDIEVAPDEPLDERLRPVERPVSCDVGKTVVDLDELKVAGWYEWGGEREAEFVEATLDPAHQKQLNCLQRPELLRRLVAGRTHGHPATARLSEISHRSNPPPPSPAGEGW